MFSESRKLFQFYYFNFQGFEISSSRACTYLLSLKVDSKLKVKTNKFSKVLKFSSCPLGEQFSILREIDKKCFISSAVKMCKVRKSCHLQLSNLFLLNQKSSHFQRKKCVNKCHFQRRKLSFPFYFEDIH